MDYIIPILAALGASIVVTIGYATSDTKNSPSVTPGNNDTSLDCVDLCLQFNNRRSERCVAEKDERNAQSLIDSLSAQVDSAGKTLAALTLLAIVASLIPIAGSIIATPLFILAAVAFATFLYFVGALNAAIGDRVLKVGITRTCLVRETEARQLLLTKCPNEAASCLATPSPC